MRAAEHQAQVFRRERMILTPFLSSDVIPALIDKFEKLLKIPDSEKKKLELDLWGKNPRDPDEGLRRGGLRGKITQKRRPGDGKDPKWRFHYTPALRDNKVVKALYGKYHDLDDLLSISHELFVRAEEKVIEITEGLRETFGLPPVIVDTNLSKLRLLRYDPPLFRSQIVAQGHFDRDSNTLHIWESRPGLRMTKARRVVVIPKNHALYFPGDKMEIATGGEVASLWHEVVDEPTEAEMADPRYSIVYFQHFLLS